MILLDTHALVWVRLDDSRVGPVARRLVAEASRANEIAVSAVTFCELAMLKSRGRLAIGVTIEQWRQRLLAMGIQEIAVDGAIFISAVDLKDAHRYPADRLTMVSCLHIGATLLTADQKILDWSHRLSRHDIRT